MQTKNKQANFRLIGNTQYGITLIELMVAMAVSSVIMLGISNIYLSTKKSSDIHEEFARIQDNMRYATNTIALNIRNAGYYGCGVAQRPRNIENRINSNETTNFNLETGIFGFEAVGTDIGSTPPVLNTAVPGGAWVAVNVPPPTAKRINAAGIVDNLTNNLNTAVPATITNLAIAGSDILMLRTADGLGIKAAQVDDPNFVFLEDTSGGLQLGACPQNGGIASVDGISGICELDVLMITDCSPRAVIFKATNFTQVGGGALGACGDPTMPCFRLDHVAGLAPGDNRAPTAWSDKRFDKDAEVMRLRTRTYFVGIAGPGAEPTLYVRNDAQLIPNPLVEGVENMQILYGVDTLRNDGVPDQYFSANNVPDVDGDPSTVFDGVVSIKLSLLVRTPQGLPGLNRTAAAANLLTYNLVSPDPNSAIVIDPIALNDVTDRRLRKVVNLTINLRNR